MLLFYSHLKEHLKDQIDTNKQMTPEEMEFHYFRYTLYISQLIMQGWAEDEIRHEFLRHYYSIGEEVIYIVYIKKVHD